MHLSKCGRSRGRLKSGEQNNLKADLHGTIAVCQCSSWLIGFTNQSLQDVLQPVAQEASVGWGGGGQNLSEGPLRMGRAPSK